MKPYHFLFSAGSCKVLRLYVLFSFILTGLWACSGNGVSDKKTSSENHDHAHDEHDHDGDAHHHAEDELSIGLTARQFETAGIVIGEPSQRSLSGSLSVNGYIDTPPYNLVTVSAILGGVIRSTDIIEGTKVRKGQILATIENPVFIQLQQDYLETKSRFDYAELELSRQDELRKEQINARKTYESARSEFRSLKARLAGLEQQLASIGLTPEGVEKGIRRVLPIHSPIAGTVTTVFINLGKQIGPTDPIFEIVNADHLHVELRVFESDLHQVRVGQSVRFTLVSNPTKEMGAKVHLINSKIDEDRTVRIHCHLDKPYPDLLPQQYVKASIETGSALLSSVPSEAIVAFENRYFVFGYAGKLHTDEHADKDTFRMTEITRGESAAGFTAIRPVNPADSLNKIAIKGSYTLLSMLKNNESDHGHAH